jgi:pimeloyl-ACP methyl ester carboxylesterase
MGTRIIERMAVEIDGQGDAVVMVHGLGGTSNTFTPQIQDLVSRFQIIRPDLPGSGRSAVVENATIDSLVEALARMLDALDLASASFVGHSLGTIICQHLAIRHPGRVRGLFLCGPLLAPPDPARQALVGRAQLAREQGMAPIADQIVEVATASETKRSQAVTIALVREMLMRQVPEGYARTCEVLAGAEAAEIAHIQCPTVLVTGDEDVIAPASVARAMAERIEGARAVILNRCGHWTTLERAEEVKQLLTEFLDRRD